MWTPPFGKSFYERLWKDGRVQSYVRPFCAARMAAGPDDIRGLNPTHVGELDALTMPRVCPIPGFDRFASRHNHSSQAEKLFDPVAGSEPIAQAATGIEIR